LRKLATGNIALHLVLTKKSELNFNDENVFPQQVRRDVFPYVTYFYTALKKACIRVGGSSLNDRNRLYVKKRSSKGRGYDPHRYLSSKELNR